jgi:hypothetical protein
VREKYGFAILTQGMIDRIRVYEPIFEVGAGLGYWAYEFNRAGISYVATDPYIGLDNTYFEGNGKRWVPIMKMSATEAVGFYPLHTMLMCWPSYQESWAYDALSLYTGSILIYVGESMDGCCADTAFFSSLNENWDEIEDLGMPQFFGLHDVAQIYRRKDGISR